MINSFFLLLNPGKKCIYLKKSKTADIISTCYSEITTEYLVCIEHMK